jgi:hypothetical protein
VVPADGHIYLLSFCTKKQKELGILVLGYDVSGAFEKRISQLTGSKVHETPDRER